MVAAIDPSASGIITDVWGEADSSTGVITLQVRIYNDGGYPTGYRILLTVSHSDIWRETFAVDVPDILGAADSTTVAIELPPLPFDSGEVITLEPELLTANGDHFAFHSVSEELSIIELEAL